jgi:hypothetical protein
MKRKERGIGFLDFLVKIGLLKNEKSMTGKERRHFDELHEKSDGEARRKFGREKRK